MARENMLNGLLLGAGLMYYLDPDRGRRRRAMVRDQLVHYSHKADHAMDTAARDMRNRAVGVASAARSRVRRDHASNSVLEARVRSTLGRVAAHPGAIHVECDDNSRVTLTGPVLARDASRVVSGILGVRGVKDVIDRMEHHESAEGVPGLQGRGRLPRRRLDVLQENWAPSTRLIVGALGGALTFRGMRADGVLGGLMAATGMGMLSRSLTNKDMRRLLGMDAGRNAVEVHKILTIDAPVEEVFSFWRDYENFPLFMSHLREVRHTGEGRSHWVADVSGIGFEWDAETVRIEENRLISWRSIGTSPVENAGLVRFQPEGQNGTRIDIHFTYTPPAGVLGHAIATFFGADPKHLMDDDLVRMKSLIEDGRTTAHHHHVIREEVLKAMEDRSGSRDGTGGEMGG